MTELALKSYTTTGSISASSSTLTVASNPGFVIGDPIIVEIGHEAGAGLRGTVGVGGVWPAKSYANQAAMVADLSQVDGTFAWLVDTGVIWRFATGTGIWTENNPINYYAHKALPKALVTTISNIVGLVFTLATPATVTTTSANVYYDNASYLNGLTMLPAVWPDGDDMVIPAGAYAISNYWGVSKNELTIRGHGAAVSELFSPDGCVCAQIYIQFVANQKVKDLSIRGNVGDDGYGLAWTIHPHTSAAYVTETTFDIQGAYTTGVIFSFASGDLNQWSVENVDLYDCFRAVVASVCTNITASHCRCIRSIGFMMYVQWDFQWATCTGGLIQDCTVDSEHLVPAFESFNSDGVQFFRCNGRNAVVSMNSSINWLFEDSLLIIEANSMRPGFTTFDWLATPVIQSNSNAIPGHGGPGVFRNITIIEEGYVDGGTGAMPGIINTNAGVTITGGYPCRPAAGGLIQLPAATPVGQGYHITGHNATISGMRCVGATSGLQIYSNNGSVTDCVADSADSPNDASPITNVITNAYYEANYDTLCPALVGVSISDLPVASALDGTELVPIVQGGNSKYTTVADISDMIWG